MRGRYNFATEVSHLMVNPVKYMPLYEKYLSYGRE
jgi:hypothetical protein